MRILNLTPHTVSVLHNNGEVVTFPVHGEAPRVSYDDHMACNIGDFSVSVRCGIEAVEGLPDEEEGVFFIVSSMVREACPQRRDLLTPDSGPDAVRNGKGHVLYVLRFIQNP